MPHITTHGAALYTQLLVGAQGETDPNNMLEIPDLRGEPSLGIEASTGDLEGFGRQAALKIQVQGTLPDFEFDLNVRFGIPTHQALILSSGILGGSNVRSGADADHPNEIVLDNGGAFVPTGAAGGTDIAFAAGRVYSWAQVYRISQTGENSYFTFDASVAGNSFSPNVQDNSVSNSALALVTLPLGPQTLAA